MPESPQQPASARSAHPLGLAAESYALIEAEIAEGGGAKGIARQHAHGRLTARERLELLTDQGTPSIELGVWAGWEMYEQYGGAPGAGVVVKVGVVSGRLAMIIANDATVKAGAFFQLQGKILSQSSAARTGWRGGL